MIATIIDFFKKLDKLTCKILKNGLIFCLVISILASIILFIYNVLETSLNYYYIGLALFKLSIAFGVELIICGLVVDGLKKQII